MFSAFYVKQKFRSKKMSEKKIAFAGAGMIGVGLAVNAMLKGYVTAIHYVRDLQVARERVEHIMNIMVNAGAASQQEADEALKLAIYTNDLKEAVENAILVEECLPERLEIKQALYKEIQEIVGDKILICSATSGIFPTKLQNGALFPEKIMVAHPYNPSYLLPLMELCGGEKTSAESVTEAKKIWEDIGKVPIICKKESEGFLVNKLSWSCMHAAQEAVKEGLCSVEDIDKAIIFGPGMRMAVTGQLLTISLGCKGGFLELAKKYGKPATPEDHMYAEGVDEEIANRKPEQGNTVESVCEWRDHMFAQILKLHGLL